MDLFHLPHPGFALWLPLAARLMLILPPTDYLPFHPPRLYSLAGTRHSEPSHSGLASQHNTPGGQDIYTQFAILRKCNNTLHTNYAGKVSLMTAICLVQHTDTDTIDNKTNPSLADGPSLSEITILVISSFRMSERHIQNPEFHCWVVLYFS